MRSEDTYHFNSICFNNWTSIDIQIIDLWKYVTAEYFHNIYIRIQIAWVIEVKCTEQVQINESVNKIVMNNINNSKLTYGWMSNFGT